MQENIKGINYAVLRRKIYEYKEIYPFAGYSVCARSWSGRALFTLSLGSKQEPALYIAGIRGGDCTGTQVLLDFFERLCSCVASRAEIEGIRLYEVLSEKGVIIIPCANPDGMEIVSQGALGAGSYAGLVERVCSNTVSWRANARGVDLNLNFACNFAETKKAAEGCGYTSPGPYFYAGKVPESEPETRALVKLCRARDIRHTVILQNGADFVYSPKVPDNGERVEMMARILELSTGFSRFRGGQSPLERCGFADWFVEKYKRPAFVLNAQGSEKEIYQRVSEALVLSLVM